MCIRDRSETFTTDNQFSNKAISYDTSDYAESSMTEEVHKVQEDKARSFLQNFIHGKNSQENHNLQNVANQNSSNINTGKLNPTQQINSHFEELKTKQKEEQKQFHRKLMQELSTSASRIKSSPSVATTGKNFITL